MGDRIKFAAFGFAALAFGTQAFADDHIEANTVIATVNGQEITVGHLILMFDDLPDQFKSYPAEILFDALYSQAIEQAVLAESLGSEMPGRVKFGTENAERDLKSSVAVERIFDRTVTPEAIQSAYEETYLNVDLGVEFNASHILLEAEEEALALLAELEAGLDFAEAAKENSTGPTGPNGGLLGWFGRGDMVGPFDAAVAEMEAGALAGPVQTQFGWHLIKLNETRPIEPPSFEEVAEELADQVGSDALDIAIDALSLTSEIIRMVPEDFDPALITDLSQLGG